MHETSVPPPESPATPQKQSRWLSRGLESLVRDTLNQAPKNRPDFHFDVVIVGSGYGGAVAAVELTRRNPLIEERPDGADAPRPGRPVSVCVLERGSEYLSGMFPERFADLAGCVRFATPEALMPRGELDGLFDFRVGPDVNLLVANGLGGGSLINAGVMEMPHPSVFKEPRWPQKIRDSRGLARRAERMRSRLGANDKVEKTRKVDALSRLSSSYKRAQITVAPANKLNSANVDLNRCIGCGDCATGCNHNAKDSLDLNLLREAHAHGARLCTGATVLKLARREDGGWTVFVNHTDRHLRERQAEPFEIRAKLVILSAGTLGSSEILLRSQIRKELEFSAQLGKKFSTNGDAIAVVRDLPHRANGVAEEGTLPGERHVGPTISGMIDLRSGDPQTDVVIQDLAVPAALYRLFQETVACASALDGLLTPGERRQVPFESEPDPAAVKPETARTSLVVAMIVRDSADGQLFRREDAVDRLHSKGRTHPNSDGLATVHWPELRNDVRFVECHRRLQKLVAPPATDFWWQRKPKQAAARVIANPMWRPLSERLEYVFGAQRGPMLSVHPLGGCPMGDDASSGVVDHLGRVFDPAAPERDGEPAIHPGLHVLDGSIIPTSLGINPSLTIATLAWRAAIQIARGLRLPPGTGGAAAAKTRPIFAAPAAPERPLTLIEVTEQLCGTVHLEGESAFHPGHRVELTLTYRERGLDALASADWRKRVLEVADHKGTLRIFDPADRDAPGREVLSAEVTGSLRVFRREASGRFVRQSRGLWAWLLNRGLRDAGQKGVQQLQELLGMARKSPPISGRYLHDIWRLSDHSGAVRLLEYELATTRVKIHPPPCGLSGAGVGQSMSARPCPKKRRALLRAATFEGRISGVKRLAYATDANPWLQLSQIELTRFAGIESWWQRLRGAWLMAPSGWREARARWRGRPVLTLNLNHLADKGVPLLRLVGQKDRPSALIALMSFAFYAFRVVLDIHALSFRKPDPALPGEASRLPGAIDRGDLKIAPEIEWLVMGVDPVTGQDVRLRLARYRCAGCDANRNPVLLIHGYSASGTTYVHGAVPGNLCETLVAAGRDVWIIDKRSSSGMPSARRGGGAAHNAPPLVAAGRDVWIIDMRSSCGMPSARSGWAFEDMATEDIPRSIRRICAKTGSAKVDIVAHCMGSAMFSMAILGEAKAPTDPLHERIGRVVMSQVGPVMQMSTANVFRAYVMRWVREFLPLADYSFRPTGEMLGNQLFDRLLATTPYPREEFRLENPRWPPGKATPWAALRHRMDALYARTFKLANMSREVLENIDDFFGPLSVETVSQVIHFARLKTIADRAGRNLYVTPFRLQSRMTFPVLYIHGAENGLVDPASLDLMRDHWRRAGIHCSDPDGPPLRSDADLLDLIAAGKAMVEGGSLLTWCIPRHGHQDPLMGVEAARVSRVIERFLGS